MTIFQEEIKEKLNEMVRNRNLPVAYSTFDCEPNEQIGHKVGDVYIKASIKKNGLVITVYIYTDEASTEIKNHDFMFELPDHKKDSSLLGKVLIDFIKLCLDGEGPIKALEMARSHNGLPS